MIEEFGGWPRFQKLLAVLERVARRRGTSIPCVALRHVLDRPGVAGTIVGTFHGGYYEANLAAVGLELTDDDRAEIDDVSKAACGPTGDVFELERVPGGPHAGLMWTHLNRES